jgi:hypothetical protein
LQRHRLARTSEEAEPFPAPPLLSSNGRSSGRAAVLQH